MSKFHNPITSPGATVLCGITLVAAGTLGSLPRLETSLAESNHNRIAQQRAQVCRVLPATEKIELGAYYFQPTTPTPDGGMTGSLLNEGEYVCDRYGTTARIERGGYAQFLAISNDVSAINKTLQQRLEDVSNPDSSEQTQVKRAVNMGVHRERPRPRKNGASEPNFFNLDN
ncbi:hypothetical protein [Leptolyngbya sp. FACHB-16]|uniref:hypothetical protein n=1 Tax=unclassified Leptolyngbya TaxID=2650499 RepID=UPI0016831B69|nr:hypothetical protein [Leptolyngbya sp. FACHB-16]MBD2156256.1 hypothetical protein [Leptolyngbya sp. FACHB-16]